ncbi:MAG: hypothetical protein AAF489_13015 [Bacteroidota bacterium]
MKKLNAFFFIFTFLSLTCTSIVAQKLNSNEIGNIEIEIPKELKSKLEGLENTDYNFRIHSKFFKREHGHVNLYFDQNDKIYKITGPSGINTTVLIQRYESSVPCPQCLPEYELSCILACIWEAILGAEDD